MCSKFEFLKKTMEYNIDNGIIYHNDDIYYFSEDGLDPTKGYEYNFSKFNEWVIS